MDQHQEQSLFDMDMDSTTQSHIYAVSKWTKFIAITAFVVLGLVLLAFAAYGREIATSISSLMSIGGGNLAGAVLAIVLVVLLLVGFWMYYLFRASSLLRKGLESRNTAVLAEGFNALRTYFIFSFIMSVLSLLSTLQSFF
jgi:Ca2+/Na+ antiporter